jgi:hypothetical protein
MAGRRVQPVLDEIDTAPVCQLGLAPHPVEKAAASADASKARRVIGAFQTFPRPLVPQKRVENVAECRFEVRGQISAASALCDLEDALHGMLSSVG